MTNPATTPPGTAVQDAEGNLIGVIKGSTGDRYIEIDRDGPNWFVPLESLDTEKEFLRINLSAIQVRAIDLKKTPIADGE
jgi:hypothetical protein